MTATSTTTSPDTPPAARRRGARPLVALLALLGVLTLLYPGAARWFSDRRHAVEITGYAEEVDRLPDAQGRAILADAAAYNAALPTGPLRGVSLAGGTATSAGPVTASYREQLVVPGTDVIASIGIPAIDLDLPVRHGTDEGTLGRGVGHLAGSSLPVGGARTHTVLTGHSGLVGSSMFDGLHDVQVGDDVVLTVLGAVLRYQVDAVEVVTPDSTGSLRIEPGEDLLTLVTCTPIGVNSHRLLIHAHRAADVAGLGDGTLGGTGIVAGFPWWAVVGGIAVVGAAVLAALPGRVASGGRTASRRRSASSRARHRSDPRPRRPGAHGRAGGAAGPGTARRDPGRVRPPATSRRSVVPQGPRPAGRPARRPTCADGSRTPGPR